MEMQLKKTHLKKKQLKRAGGWYTKTYLANVAHWAKSMIEAAWKWAAKTNNLRKNEIHGEEEARLCLTDEFQLLDEEGQEISIQGALELDDARMQ
ncbi:unnamed protein product [Symbiodinium sp. CCMP2592]|nr:unnamed protein product [Symbiodinium sp. CCMP2592]